MRALILAVLLSLLACLYAQDEIGLDRMTRTAINNWLVPYPRVGKRSAEQDPFQENHFSLEKRLYLARVGKRAYFAARVGNDKAPVHARLCFGSMLVLSLLAIAGLASAATDPRYKYIACDPIKLQTCQAQFNDALGIDPSLGVTTYQDLSQSIQYVWGVAGVAGLRASCEAFKGYKTCFDTPTGYQDCAQNPLGLLADVNGTATGITVEQAYGYSKIFNQNDFACASGFPQFANNADCAQKVFQTKLNDIQGCSDDFWKSVTAVGFDPNLICVYARQAKNCVQAIFQQTCPGVSSLGWWGCQWERTGLETSFPQCSGSFCTMNN